jgi:leucyl-tRNA synthetase
MRGTLKMIRDAEITLPKRMQKGKKGKGGKNALFDPKKPKLVWVYATTEFLEWRETCVQAVKDSYTSTSPHPAVHAPRMGQGPVSPTSVVL